MQVMYYGALSRSMMHHTGTKIMISDRGREFVNRVSQELFATTNTKHKISTAYHPQTNGLVDRFTQRALLKLVKKEQDD